MSTTFVDNYLTTPGINYRGGITQQVVDMNFVGLRKPYLDKFGRPSVDIFTGKTTLNKGVQCPVKQKVLIRDVVNEGMIGANILRNATAMPKESWIAFDQVALRAARWSLRAYADLANANTYGGFDGWSATMLEHETMTDPGEAIVDMSGVTQGRNDAPQYQLQGLPLPVTHCDFWCDSRSAAAMRRAGRPFDATMGEAACRRVAESVERVTIGVDTGLTYGGNSTQVGGYGRASSVYGFINFPNRLISTAGYKPTGNGRSGTGWSPLDTVDDVLAIRNLLYAQKFKGPFIIYHSTDWDQYLDRDYQVFTVSGSNYGGQMTLRERLKKIENISDVRRLDFLPATAMAANDPGRVQTGFPFRFLFVQQTPDVARAVNGLDMTVLQWEEMAGLLQMFKCMAIQVPQLRCDAYGNCGLADVQFTQ